LRPSASFPRSETGMFNTGDYVQHVRRGPGRILDVQADQLVVRERLGQQFRVNAALADAELRRVPADGFVALLYHRDPDPSALLNDINDVLLKIARDVGRRSVTITQVREVLEPILRRHSKKWATWWKVARGHIRSEHIRVNSKKRLIEFSRSDAGKLIEAPQDSTDSKEVLAIARRLADLENDPSADAARNSITGQLLARLSRATAIDEQIVLVLAACYMWPHLTDTLVAAVREALEKLDPECLLKLQALQDDLLACLPKLLRIAPSHSRGVILALTDHPNRVLAERAFDFLNNDRTRDLLRNKFLRWLKSTSSGRLLPNLELYLNRGFLRFVRQEDVGILFSFLVEHGSSQTGVRDFLNSEDAVKAFGPIATKDPGAATVALSSPLLLPTVKQRIAELLPSATQFLSRTLESADHNRNPAIEALIGQISADGLRAKWNDIRDYLVRSGEMNAYQAIAGRLSVLLDQSEGPQRDELLATAVDLANIADQREVEVNNLVRAIKSAVFSRTGRSILSKSIQEAVDAGLSSLRENVAAAESESSRLRLDLISAQTELKRSQQLLEMLKGAGTADLTEAWLRGRREVLLPILTFLDELDRLSSYSGLAANLLTTLQGMGVVRTGTPGDVVAFNSVDQELVATGGATERVKILRPGYTLATDRGTVLLRRALVVPHPEKADDPSRN